MEKKQLAVVVVVVGVVCSAALAGAPLGPPRSLVEHGQWAINFEYGHEELDLKTYGKIWDRYIVDGSVSEEYCGYTVMQVSDLELNAFFGSLEYGLCDRWEVFVRLGIADAQDDVAPMYCFEDEEDEEFNFDGDYGFAWGAGTKMTICQHGDWTFGGVIQVTWLYPDESDLTWVNPADANDCFDGEGDLDLRQIQAGIGATLDLSSMLDGGFVYGGICWCFFRGDFDVDGSFYDTDVEYLRIDAEHNVDEEHEFGFWAGLGCQLETAVCFAEFQWLDDYWLVGGGVKIPLP
jgi:hypothetical protein